MIRTPAPPLLQDPATHPQVKQLTYDRVEVQVDEGIAPMLKQMWERQIFTTASCQGQNGEAYITVLHVNGAMAFTRMILASGVIPDFKTALVHDERILPTTMVAGIGKTWEPEPNLVQDAPARTEQGWVVNAVPATDKITYQDRDKDTITFRFPAEDVAKLGEAFAALPDKLELSDEDKKWSRECRLALYKRIEGLCARLVEKPYYITDGDYPAFPLTEDVEQAYRATLDPGTVVPWIDRLNRSKPKFDHPDEVAEGPRTTVDSLSLDDGVPLTAQNDQRPADMSALLAPRRRGR